MKTACIVVAAGRGTRAVSGAISSPKQYQRIGGLPVLTRTIAGLMAHPGIGPILVVIHAEDRPAYEAATAHFGERLLPPVIGGATRQDSVRHGLEALAAFAPAHVLIHDAARPFVTRDMIDRVIAALADGAGAIPALAVADTLKRGAAGMTVSGTVPRNGLYRAQTPQGFRFADILAAHRAAALENRSDFTDDAAVAEWRGLRVTLVEGDEHNRKLTTVQDIREADRDFRDGAQEGQERRNGLCRLSHPMEAGAPLTLFGVAIPNRLGLAGADGFDLGLRAVAGALLDVVGGEDDEAQTELADAVRRAEESGGGIASVDVTLIADGLSIEAQVEAMRAALAERLGLQKARVGIRTGRAQQLGLLHRADELSVLASVTVNVPVIAATAMPRAAKRAAPAALSPSKPAPGAPSAVTGEGTPLLDTIRSPADLRRLDDSILPQLADELRRETISAVSETGGHLGAGLGVVELTLAIHKVFDTPQDRLIWDVGHQAYPHKIITGRRDRIRTLRQGGGLSGFTKRAESEYDPFGAAHSSTSISAGLGMAVARDLRGEKNNVIAVIGDGSMSAGMAYEAMNNAGARGERLIVILNDNDMSIAQPVGSLSAYLARLSSSSAYFRLRDAVKSLAKKLPERWERRAARTEELTRTYWTGGTLFEELGFHYIGPLDGHDFDHLLPVLRNARDARSGPILIHVVTRKGKGYAPAEAADDKYHGVNRFNVITGAQVKPPANAPSYTRVFADTLIQEARRDPDIVAVTAAMPTGTGLDIFGKEFPSRTFDVGIAEQHAVTFAAGLATEGFKPFVAIYSTFLQRAYDQIVHDVAIQNLPVRFALDRAGLVGADGPTHAGSFDIAYLGCVPNMVLMAAADEADLRHMVATQVALDDAPSALRFPRGEGVGVDMPERGVPLEIGRGRVIREGERVALLSYGTRLAECLKAADALAAQGISVTVADARFAKPLDADLVERLARAHELVVTVEEGSTGGFGAFVVTHLVNAGVDLAGVKLRTMVLPDVFIDQDKPERMYAQAGLDAAGIVATVLGTLDPIAAARLVAKASGAN